MIFKLNIVSNGNNQWAGFKINYEVLFDNNAINCQWGDFFQVTPCSKPCNRGTRIMIRRIVQVSKFGGAECLGLSYDLKAICNPQPCCKYL